MAYGVEQQIGQGEAQVFPRSKGGSELINNLQQERQYQFQRERQTKADEEKRSNELYSLIGNELNPRDFNAVIHYKVNQAQKDLASKIIANPKLSYGEMYLMAHNKAAELGQTSDTLNRLDQQIALTRKEYEGDRRLNMGVAELAARKKILDKIQNGEKLDENVNYIDEAMNDPVLQKSLLTDNSNYIDFDMKAHKMDDITGGIRKKVAGRTTAFNYNVDNIPAYYTVTPGKTEYDEPTITTNAEYVPDSKGNVTPILSQSAYDAVKLKPSNINALNNIIQDKYGKNIDLRSQQADVLRRKEAYDMLEAQKPKVNAKRSELQPNISINTGGYGSGSGAGKSAANWVERAASAINSGDFGKVQDEMAELIGGDKNEYQGIVQQGDKLAITYKPPQKFAIDGTPIPKSDEPVTVIIDPKDPYLKNHLVRLRQTIMGGDAPLERTQFSKQNTQPAIKPNGIKKVTDPALLKQLNQ